MATTPFQKLLGNLSSNPNVKNLVSDLQRLSKDLKYQGNKLNLRLNQQKEKTIRKAHIQYKKILNVTGRSQQDLNRELGRALTLIKRSAADVEKNLQYYRKKATTHSRRLEKYLSSQPGGQGTAKRTTKKTARRTTRKRA